MHKEKACSISKLCEPGQQSKLGIKFHIGVCVYGSIKTRQDKASLHPSNGAKDEHLPGRCWVTPAHPVS